MPHAAPKPCTWYGCPALVRDGGVRCQAHRQQAEQERGTARERGYSVAWQKAREGFLRLHPLCECKECDGGRLQVTPAEVVDHTIPHRGDMKLFWDRSNWKAMSKRHHDRKTATEDGGFGRGGGQMSTAEKRGTSR
jgi:5-methylcytosine-specific restriction protein A